MNTLKRFIEVVAVVTLLAGSAIHSRAATTVISALPAVTAAGSNDLLIVDTSNGPSSYTTQKISQSQLFSKLYGNAQGGGITNLDSSIFNVKDYGGNVNNAYSAMTNSQAAGVLYFPATSGSWTTSTRMVVGPNLQSGDGPAFTLRGTGTGDGGIGWTGANSVVFDATGFQFQGVGLNFEHLRAANNIGTSTGTNSFYIEGWGGLKAVRWDDLLLSQWLVGAEPSQSGADISALQLKNNAVGLWLPYQSDVDFINVSWSVGNTNAAIYADSNSHHIQYNSAGDNIGVIFDRGGGSILSGSAESVTNAFATYGDPSNLPSWFTNNANAAGMQGLTIENGYMIGGGITNANSQGYPALVKIYNASAAAPINIRNFGVTLADAVVFRTNVDSIQPINFDGVTVNASNLADFSDGTFLTAATASGLTTGHVGLNTTEQEFTKSTLEYGRDRSGNLYVRGTVSNGLLAPSSAGGVVTTTGAGVVDYGLQVGASLNAAVSFNQQVATGGYPTTTALPAYVFAGPQYWEGFGPNDTSSGFMRLGPAATPFNGSGSAWVIFGSHAQSGLVVDAPAGVGLNVAATNVNHSLDVNGTTAAQFRQGIATTGTAVGPMAASGYTNATGTNIICIGNFNATACTYVLRDASGAAWLTNTGNASPFFVPLQAGGSMTLTAGSISIGYWHVQ